MFDDRSKKLFGMLWSDQPGERHTAADLLWMHAKKHNIHPHDLLNGIPSGNHDWDAVIRDKDDLIESLIRQSGFLVRENKELEQRLAEQAAANREWETERNQLRAQVQSAAQALAAYKRKWTNRWGLVAIGALAVFIIGAMTGNSGAPLHAMPESSKPTLAIQSAATAQTVAQSADVQPAPIVHEVDGPTWTFREHNCAHQLGVIACFDRQFLGRHPDLWAPSTQSLPPGLPPDVGRWAEMQHACVADLHMEAAACANKPFLLRQAKYWTFLGGEAWRQHILACYERYDHEPSCFAPRHPRL